MDSPFTISIITVCYNSAQTIENTLHSVIAQDYPHIEYIVIDGASTDGTLDILNKYKNKIHLLISEKDNGMYHAMNKGIAIATGNIVGLLHADDIYADSTIITEIAKVFENQDIDACYGNLVYFGAKPPHKIYRYWRSNTFKPGLFAKGWCPPHPTLFVRRQFYLQHGNFNTTYTLGNDIELMMRFFEKYHIRSVYLPMVIVKMRLGGTSNRKVKNIIEQNKNILQAARTLNIPISPLKFIVCKIFNRVFQIFTAIWRMSYAK